MSSRPPLVSRLLRGVRIDRESGCWLRTTSLGRNGYAYIGLGRSKVVLAHRTAYEMWVGPIPAGLTLDHLCRRRACINPAHLEPVPLRENLARGKGRSALNARKTHCARGHRFDESNTYRTRDGRRACRACHRAASAAAYRRKRREAAR